MRDTASWVIVDKASRTAIAETFLPHVAAAINTIKYEAVPIHDWLIEVNQRIRAAATARQQEEL